MVVELTLHLSILFLHGLDLCLIRTDLLILLGKLRVVLRRQQHHVLLSYLDGLRDSSFHEVSDLAHLGT